MLLLIFALSVALSCYIAARYSGGGEAGVCGALRTHFFRFCVLFIPTCVGVDWVLVVLWRALHA